MMLEIEGGRVTDAPALSTREIVKTVAQRGRLVVQFSKPGTYPPGTLNALNEACQQVGERLQVRFFGHYGTAFDAGTLRHLPDVQNLAVDCLDEIASEDEIGRLQQLRALSIGVFELNRPDLLTTIKLGQLRRLSLGENRKRNLDLSPLAGALSLEDLHVEGHSKGIVSTAAIPGLRSLTLRAFAKRYPLDFVTSLHALNHLKVILGARTHIDDLSSKSLKILQILRVRGLESLGDLSRLPALSALRVEDQLQLAAIDLTGVKLQRLWLSNCTNLTELAGLDAQDRLQAFFASQVGLELNGLRDLVWPSEMRSVQLSSNSTRWNELAKVSLAARGLTEESEPWP
jgi:hypothetical protein